MSNFAILHAAYNTVFLKKTVKAKLGYKLIILRSKASLNLAHLITVTT